jgi:hypothetical protein
MFLGHFAVALGAKRLMPRASLGVLFLSAQLPDVLWPIFLLLGWEHVDIVPGMTAVTPLNFYDYPISHSLVADLGWACTFALVYWIFRRDWTIAIFLGAGVLSHWVLDVLVHRPDVPVFFHGPYLGLGLWESRPATLVVEFGAMMIGTSIYQTSTKASNTAGKIGYTGLMGFLVVAYMLNIFGPPPPSVSMLALVGNAGLLLVVWAAWVDRHRTATRTA